jgi:hypothetical protein
MVNENYTPRNLVELCSSNFSNLVFGAIFCGAVYLAVTGNYHPDFFNNSTDVTGGLLNLLESVK